MDQRPIQFCTTQDGVDIGFWEMGEGHPLIYLPGLPMSAQLDWQLAGYRSQYEHLASRHRLIRVDRRNTGLSQRGVEDVSPEASLLDVDAVVGHLRLETLDLWGLGMSGALAVQYAATHTELVRRLVLVNASFRFPDANPLPALLALRAVLEYDWESYTEMIAGLTWGWSHDHRGRYAEVLRASTTWEDFRRTTWFTAPAHRFLDQVTAPTLVIHHRDALAATLEMGRRVASAIPNARLVTLEGRAVATPGDPQMMAAADAFFGEDAHERNSGDESAGTAIILFADIADSTALTERIGDAAFRERARELDQALRRAISSNGGHAIEGKVLGDGVLATFGAAREAIGCAHAMHDAASAVDLKLHVGIHAGDVLREDGNIYGGTVNIASRVASDAAAGETLVSQTVRDLARTSAGVSFEDRGERELKGVGEPVRVYEVRWRE